MAVAMWAKSAVGTNLAFVKGFGKALKSWRDVIQQTVLKRAPLRQPKVPQVTQPSAKEKCLFQIRPSDQLRATESLQSRVFRSLFSRTTSKSLASELRRRAACRLSSSRVENFRNVPIFSLIGVTLGIDAASLISSNTEKVMEDMQGLFSGYGWQAEALSRPPQSLQDLDISLESLASGCEGAVYKAKVKPLVVSGADNAPHNETGRTDEDFDLAVKAVFNYGAASNAESLLREMRREYVPLHMKEKPEDDILADRVGRLPPHPNIVDMPGVFQDDVLVTEEGLRKFPAAMPRRLDPENCWGRNKTLYVVMRRRSSHLREYLSTNEVTMETRCLLLAQLLEGVAHLEQHGIAHRDLKADNLLVDVPRGGGVPKLEICDFGCCLAEEDKALRVDFPCVDVYKGGNSWLMAPEIATAVPGRGRVLDYSRSDLWACGTIAYEILGGENPFYPSQDGVRRQLSTRDYTEEDLPALPACVPEAVQSLVFALLARDPRERPSPSVAAAVVQMVVLASSPANVSVPKACRPRRQPPTTHPRGHCAGRERGRGYGRGGPGEVPRAVLAARQERDRLQWVLVQSLALLCQLTFGRDRAEVWDVPAVMRFLFLSRLTHADFRQALAFF